MVPFKLILALIAIESGGNDMATGRAEEAGCLQIRPIVVQDLQRLGHRYTMADRLDRHKSIQMCRIYIAHYATPARLGHQPDMEDMARIWHGGPDGWRKPHTRAYWLKVRRYLYGGT